MGSGSKANSGSVVLRNSGSSGGRNSSGSGFVINNVKEPTGILSFFTGGSNTNIATGGRTSNKNSIVIE